MTLEDAVRGTVAGIGILLIPFGTGIITGIGRAQGYDFSQAEVLTAHIIPPITGLIGGGAILSENGKGLLYGGMGATALMFGGQLLGYGMGQFLKS